MKKILGIIIYLENKELLEKENDVDFKKIKNEINFKKNDLESEIIFDNKIDYLNYLDFKIIIISFKNENIINELFNNIKLSLDTYLNDKDKNLLINSIDILIEENNILKNTKNDLNDIKLKMKENINEIYDREIDLNDIEKNTNDILNNSEKFQKTANQIKNRMLWKKRKIIIYSIIIILSFIFLFYICLKY